MDKELILDLTLMKFLGIRNKNSCWHLIIDCPKRLLYTRNPQYNGVNGCTVASALTSVQWPDIEDNELLSVAQFLNNYIIVFREDVIYNNSPVIKSLSSLDSCCNCSKPQ